MYESTHGPLCIHSVSHVHVLRPVLYIIQSNFAMHHGTKLFAKRLVRVLGIGRSSGIPEFTSDSSLGCGGVTYIMIRVLHCLVPLLAEVGAPLQWARQARRLRQEFHSPSKDTSVLGPRVRMRCAERVSGSAQSPHSVSSCVIEEGHVWQAYSRMGRVVDL